MSSPLNERYNGTPTREHTRTAPFLAINFRVGRRESGYLLGPALISTHGYRAASFCRMVCTGWDLLLSGGMGRLRPASNSRCLTTTDAPNHRLFLRPFVLTLC